MNSEPWISIRFVRVIIAAFGACLLFSPFAQAVTPAPDGGYPANNTAEGTQALLNLTSGIDNTALGFQAQSRTTTGNYNTATGFRALSGNTSGQQNTATGVNALLSNTTGRFNTATGSGALVGNTTGSQNTATGVGALKSNTTGTGDTAYGYQAAYNTVDPVGGAVTAIGIQTCFSNTSGYGLTAVGNQALYSNTTGYGNVAVGPMTLLNNTIGHQNDAYGSLALQNNVSGNRNSAIGHFALSGNTTGSNNVAVGFNAGSSLDVGDDNVDIANDGMTGESGTIRIGTQNIQTSAYIAGIFGSTESSTQVYVNSQGHLGVPSSSARFKKDVKPMETASEAILALKPVTFRYKSDNNGTPQFGLVAEEVASVNPDLVVRDDKGEIYTVRYEAVNAMLLNEFLKEHRKVEHLNAKVEAQTSSNSELRSTVALQQKQIETLAAQLKKQSAQIEKVSAEMAVSRGPSQVAVSER